MVGNKLKIDFDIESREYNSRWYTDVKAWKVEAVGAGSSGSGDAGLPVYDDEPIQNNSGDDLPF